VAKISASLLFNTPVASGRFAVRFINLSDSDSITMLKALALPAARVPPIKVAIVNVSEGSPSFAKTIAGRVETNKSSTTRNFIRSIKPRSFCEVFTPDILGTGKDYSALMRSVLIVL
jgi:hypothetical protein